MVAPGNIEPTVGHEFLLEMPGWGNVACTVLQVEPELLLVYTFADWTLRWRLEPEGHGTRLFLEHAGSDLDNPPTPVRLRQHGTWLARRGSAQACRGRLKRDPVGGGDRSRPSASGMVRMAAVTPLGRCDRSAVLSSGGALLGWAREPLSIPN